MQTSSALTWMVGLICLSACGSTDSSDAFTTPTDPAGGDAGSVTGPGGSSPISVGPDGGTSRDAGPGGNAQTLACGATACARPEACCVTNNDKANTFTFACTTAASCNANDRTVTLECSGPANCGSGEVCCIGDDGSGNKTATCRTSCTSGGGVDRAILCDPAAPTVGCPVNAPCSSNSIEDWKLPNGFGTCGGKGN